MDHDSNGRGDAGREDTASFPGLGRRDVLAGIGTLAAGVGVSGIAGGSHARSEDAQAVLEYLRGRSQGTFDGIVSGQNCGHGDEITWRYPEYVEQAHQDSGEWIGMVGLDYEYAADFSAAALSDANEYLIDHWNRGGLVEINATANQPFSTATGHENVRDTDADIDMQALIDPDTTRMSQRPGSEHLTVHEYWTNKLDRIGAALQELRDAGVVVVWRPMQEPDGFWFWYGTGQDQNPEQDYVAVWRHMHEYLSDELGLDNLLWAYSRCEWGKEFGQANPYPGDDYVDLVTPTLYDDGLDLADWQGTVTQAGGNDRAIGFGELGPALGEATGDWDTRTILERARTAYPRAAFWMSWHSWDESNQIALVDNQHYVELLRHEDVVTAPVPWDQGTDGTPTPTDAGGGMPSIDGSTPTDPDGDGVFEDVNANGRVDNDDVVTYFEHMDDPAITDNVAAYDFNENGRIDFDDVVTLFEQL